MESVRKPNILIGISASIGAHKKVCKLINLFRIKGYTIEVTLTKNARHMVRLPELKILADVFHDELLPSGFDFEVALQSGEFAHIELGNRIDALLLVPTTANTIAKLANGIADDLLTAVALCTKAPVIMCPAMNENMWLHPATQRNIKLIDSYGYHRIGPTRGRLFSKSMPVGDGSSEYSEVIVDRVDELIKRKVGQRR